MVDKQTLFTILLAGWVWAVPALGEEAGMPVPDAPVNGTAAPAAEPSVLGPVLEPIATEIADTTHEFVSTQLESWARRLDSFFGGDRALEESTGSYLRVRGWWYGQGEQIPEKSFDARLRLVLPRTQEKLRIEIESDPRSEQPEEDRSQIETLATTVETREDFIAGLRAILLETVDWRANITGGVRLKFPLDPYVRGSLRRRQEMGEWTLKVEQTAFWFSSDGFGARTSAVLDRPVSDPMLLRSVSSALWTEEDVFWTLSESLSLFQPVYEDIALSYRAGVVWFSDPVVRPEEYSVDITYRQRVFSSWLFFDFRPGMRWPRENGFAPTPGLFLRLEAFFGEKSLKEAKRLETKP
jgi:hypothetical protein